MPLTTTATKMRK